MYRSAPVDLTKRTAAPGLVDDLVKQFADSYAYLRELVQNALDAGATRIECTIHRTLDGQVTTTVDDDGAGMDRAILEGPLLTLFSSSKEHDRSTIGKYGIGFISVLASEPVHVEVVTRAGAQTWLLRLFGDHAYELEQAPERAHVGTSVTLLHGMTETELDAHRERAVAALRHWCRYARVPIRLHATDAADPARASTHAITEPFVLPGIESVTERDDHAWIVVTVRSESADDVTGYFNRGLTLFQSSEPEPTLAGLSVWIDSPDLGHTLSRDDVVRDRTQRSLVERAAAMARGPLRETLFAQLETAAHHGDLARVEELLDALGRPCFAPTGDAVVPLLHPLDDASVMSLRQLESHSPHGILVADEPSLQSRVLARAGIAVVRGVHLAPALRRCAHRATRISPIPADLETLESIDATTTSDRELLSHVVRELRQIGESPTRALLATCSTRGRWFRFVQTHEDFAVISTTAAIARWREGNSLFLDVLDPAVAEARRAATSDPRLAAHLLARMLLLETGPLADGVVDRWLRAAAKELP